MSENMKKDFINIIECDDKNEVAAFETMGYDLDPFGDDITYSISIMDKYMGNSKASLSRRIANAFRILCGKKVYYAEVLVSDKEKMKKWLEDNLTALK